MAEIGHNNPPPELAIKERLDDLTAEAGNWLDGAAIENEGQAAAVATLQGMAREIAKDADAARKAEAKPFDDGKKAVQAKWKPLIDAAERIQKVAGELQTGWLLKVRRKQEAERRIAEEAARKAAAELEAARTAALPGSLSSDAAVEAAAEAAARAEMDRKRAEAARANAKGAVGRAAHLRTDYSARIVDLTAAARHYWQTDREALRAWVQEMADRDMRTSRGTAEVPGVEPVENVRAV